MHPIGDGGGGKANTGEEVARLFVVAGGDGAPVFQAIEGALDDVPLFVGDGIEGRQVASLRHRRDDRLAALDRQESAHVVGVGGLVADQARGCRGNGEQRPRPLYVVHLAPGQEQSVEPPELVAERVDFRGATAARAADGLVALPPFAPDAERCALTEVLSTMARSGGSPQSASAANNSCHSPRWLQRLNRLNSVVRGPYASGTARQRRPSRNRCRMPLITRRSSTRGLPPKCGSNGAIAAHCVSFSQNSSAMIQAPLPSLNQTRRGRCNGYRL